MENKNTRNIILAILGIIILGAGAFYLFSPKTNNDINIADNNNQENILPEFGSITPLIKTDLSKEEKENLKIILEQKKDREMQIKDILDKAYKNGKMEEAWAEVDIIVNNCKKRIQSYLKEGQEEKLDRYMSEFLERIESNYVQK